MAFIYQCISMHIKIQCISKHINAYQCISMHINAHLYLISQVSYANQSYANQATVNNANNDILIDNDEAAMSVGLFPYWTSPKRDKQPFEVKEHREGMDLDFSYYYNSTKGLGFPLLPLFHTGLLHAI
jgi:hypothetical protein